MLVRHAESARQVAKPGRTFYANDEARRPVAGIPDRLIPLTDSGRSQARACGVRLRETFGSFDLAYHSGYVRAVDTLSDMLEAFSPVERESLSVREDILLRERDDGFGHDMTESEAAAAFPWLQAYWQANGKFYSRPPGGESLADVVLRAHLFLRRLYHEATGRRVLIVAHGGSIRCLRFLIEQWSVQEMEHQLAVHTTANCAVTCYERDDESGAFVTRMANTVL